MLTQSNPIKSVALKIVKVFNFRRKGNANPSVDDLSRSHNGRLDELVYSLALNIDRVTNKV